MSEQLPTGLAARIKAARNRSNLSQSQAAKEWGISKRTLQQWEQSRSSPRGLALAALEDIISRKPKRKTPPR